MSMPEPYVYVFKTPNNHYVYDVNTNRICRISSESYRILKNKELYNEELIELKNVGLLKEKRVEKYWNPVSCYVDCMLNVRLSYVLLQLTQQCNLRCNYCLYSGSYCGMRLHSEKNMNTYILKETLDFLINHSAQSKELNIGFYGGEPLIRMDLINQVFNYMNELCPSRKVNYSMTTNATLLTPSISDSLVKHSVKLKISLDGPESIHNANRTFINGKGSYNKIIKNLQYIYTSYPDYYRNNISFNAVYDGSHLYDDILEFFASNNLLKNNRISLSNINTTFENTLDEHNEMKKDCRLSYLKNAVLYYYKSFICPEEYRNELFDSLFSFEDLENRLENQFEELPDKFVRTGLCIPGIARVFVNTDGEFYLCEKVSEKKEGPYCIGNIKQGFDYKKIINLLNLENKCNDGCLTCWAFRLCDICAAKVDIGNSNYEEQLKHRCNALKQQVASRLRDYCHYMELKERYEERR